MIRIAKKIIRKIPYSDYAIVLGFRFLRWLLGNSPVNKTNLIKLQYPNRHTFFGYYDISPFNWTNDRVLALVLPKNANEGDNAEIGYFDLKDPQKFNKVGTSKAWCWQQGSRLRWLSSEDHNLISYNRLEGNRFVNCIQDVESREIKFLHRALYDLHFSSQIGLSLNFSRLQRLRPGYGYGNLMDNSAGRSIPSNDGIFSVNLETDESELIVSYEGLLANFPMEGASEYEHYFNHISISPNGEKFIFFHLFSNSSFRGNRLFLYNLKTENLSMIDDEHITSHYTWKNNQELLVTFVDKNGVCRYGTHNFDNHTLTVVGEKHLTIDGHPSYVEKQVILTDTYPDKFSDQSLFLFDMDDKEVKMIGQFYKPPKYKGETRVDLHPRIDRRKSRISFDSAHGGLRAQYIVEMSN